MNQDMGKNSKQQYKERVPTKLKGIFYFLSLKEAFFEANNRETSSYSYKRSFESPGWCRPTLLTHREPGLIQAG